MSEFSMGEHAMVTAGYLERSVKVGNLKLSYQEWGNPQAQPIIMLHGFGVSGHMFDEFAGRMQDRYRLIALDQRGHGDSDWAEDGDYTRTAFVEDLEGFRHELGIDRFILMGHSMGGLNSVTYTNRYPQHVSALVLVDVGPESAKEGVDNIVRFTRGPDELEFEEFVELAHRFNQRRTLENIRERMRHRLKPTETGKYTWKFDKRFRQPDSGLRIGGEAANDDSWALFRGVRVPALLVRGSESDVLSQEVAERAASEMPRARLIVIPGAGHSVPGDSPDAFTDGVREFLGDLEHGEFEPAAAAPPLERLMEEHTAASRRGSSLILLAAAGAAAVLIIAGAGFAARRSSQKRSAARAEAAQRRTVRGRAATAAGRLPLHSADVEHARERAAEVVARLGVAGAEGSRRARESLSQIDLDHARLAAQDALAILSEGSRHAPANVRAAVGRADRGRARKGGSMALAVTRGASLATIHTAARLLNRKRQPTPKPARRIARWRN
ncbi:MAG: alpha/beta hydrolase [Dehalococcoidia bacterium]|nr:alpha/beta hydrolase [Dehalococcoidia bacterium]